MYNKKEKQAVIKMRREGHSYSFISLNTGIAKSTLSKWLKDVPYTPNEETKQRVKLARVQLTHGQIHRKKKSIDDAYASAKKELGTITKRDLFMLGLGLYIGEGSKSAKAQVVKISNAEPEVIKTSVAWLESIGVPKENMTLAIHVYPDIGIDSCISFWERVSGIPRSQFGKTQIDVRAKSKVKKGKCPYGTAHVRVRGLGNSRLGVYLYRHIEGLMLEAFKQINTRV